MKNGLVKFALYMSPMILGLAGCSPSGSTAGSADVASLGANCAGQHKIVNLESLGLQGKTQAAAGELVMTSFNQDLNCAADTEVQWSLSTGGKVVSSDKTRMVAQFEEAGRYLVQAKVAGGAQMLSQSTLVLDQVPVIEGPQVGLLGQDLSFHVVAPSGMSVASVTWNFADGGTATGANATHMYELTGEYEVHALVQLQGGASYDLKQKVTVLEFFDDLACVTETRVFATQEGQTGATLDFSVTIPACLQGHISAVRWNFGDGSLQIPGVAVQHAFATAGTYEVKADVYSPLGSDGILFSVVHRIRISDPKPDLPDPKCPTLGEVRSEFINQITTTAACGVDGKREVVKHTKVTYECQYLDPVQDWAEVSRVEEVKSEGECLGQSCVLSDGTKLNDKGSRPFYSSTRPAGSCQSVVSSRTCVNGKLDGSDSFQALTCEDGCPGFGPHGTAVSGVVIGEVKVDLQCQFNETGFFDLFTQVEDRQCQKGQVVTSNLRQGTLKQKGACPTYAWAATDTWTTCTADCGGKQTQIHTCKDQNGAVAPAARCTAAMPNVERVCDRNPAAVRRDDVTTVHEEANSSNRCPQNQIGIILKSRDVTTTKSYACVNHAVKLTGEKVVATAWVEEKYCRDYVAHRCSQDSLSLTAAKGRYDWMVKCQNSVPIIKEFLENFDDVRNSQNATIDSGRLLYPTFMEVTSKRTEKPWIAPTDKNASCVVPAKIYVAAVCVASCATPEQRILTEINGDNSFAGETYIEALTRKTQSVVTVTADSGMDGMKFESTPVSQWVSELIDGDHPVLEFVMNSGGTLRVTPNHPLVDSTGIMREAKDLKIGESLVKMGGESDQIVAINSQIHYGKVYNVFTASSDLNRNLVVTSGYINGTAFYQNEGAINMNRQVLRKRLVEGAFNQ